MPKPIRVNLINNHSLILSVLTPYYPAIVWRKTDIVIGRYEMPIDYADQQKIKDHLQGNNNQCPLCGTNNWAINDEFVSPLFIDLEYKRPIEGKLLPMVVLICNDCGYVRLVAAGKVGLLS